MPETPVDRLINTYNTLKQDRRGSKDNHYQELADYMAPSKSEIIRKTIQSKKQHFIFDSTAPNSLSIAVSAIQGTLTPSTIKWFSLRGLDGALMSEISDAMFMGLNNSNFPAEMQMCFEDLLLFGICCLHISERDIQQTGEFSGLRFKSYMPGTYCIMENADGIVDTVFREFEPTLLQVVQRYDIDKLSDKSQRLVKENKLDNKINLLHVSMPRENAEHFKVDGLIASVKKPFAQFVIEMENDQTGTLLEESGSDVSPYVVARWKGADYGRSPAMDILADVKTLNKAVEMRLQSWAKSINPPYLVNNIGIFGNLDLRPGAQNTVKTSVEGAVKELITEARFDVANFQEEGLKNAIRQGLFIDQIQFPPMEGTPVSATEFAGRFETMQRVLGPILGRLENELLQGILMREFSLMQEGQAFQGLEEDILNIQFDGPLARTQRSSDVESISRYYQVALPISQSKPEILDAVNHQKIGNKLAEASGLPGDTILTDEQMQQISQARAQAEEAANRQEELLAGAKAMHDAAPAAMALNQVSNTDLESGV